MPGKRRGHETWKYRDQCAAKPAEPHFVPRPQRPDRRNHLPPLLGRSSDKPVEHSSTEIASIQGHVDDEHQADNAVPRCDHTSDSSPRLATTSSSGPWAISRPTRKRKSRPSTK